MGTRRPDQIKIKRKGTVHRQPILFQFLFKNGTKVVAHPLLLKWTLLSQLSCSFQSQTFDLEIHYLYKMDFAHCRT